MRKNENVDIYSRNFKSLWNKILNLLPSTNRLGHHPFTVAIGVRIPLGVPNGSKVVQILYQIANEDKSRCRICSLLPRIIWPAESNWWMGIKWSHARLRLLPSPQVFVATVRPYKLLKLQHIASGRSVFQAVSYAVLIWFNSRASQPNEYRQVANRQMRRTVNPFLRGSGLDTHPAYQIWCHSGIG